MRTRKKIPRFLQDSGFCGFSFSRRPGFATIEPGNFICVFHGLTLQNINLVIFILHSRRIFHRSELVRVGRKTNFALLWTTWRQFRPFLDNFMTFWTAGNKVHTFLFRWKTTFALFWTALRQLCCFLNIYKKIRQFHTFLDNWRQSHSLAGRQYCTL